MTGLVTQAEVHNRKIVDAFTVHPSDLAPLYLNLLLFLKGYCAEERHNDRSARSRVALPPQSQNRAYPRFQQG